MSVFKKIKTAVYTRTVQFKCFGVLFEVLKALNTADVAFIFDR